VTLPVGAADVDALAAGGWRFAGVLPSGEVLVERPALSIMLPSLVSLADGALAELVALLRNEVTAEQCQAAAQYLNRRDESPYFSVEPRPDGRWRVARATCEDAMTEELLDGGSLVLLARAHHWEGPR